MSRDALRAECQEDLAALRAEPDFPERAFRLLEKLVARLDRLETGIETGELSREEAPTRPDTRRSSKEITAVPWNAQAVQSELAEGRAKAGLGPGLDGEK